MVIPVEQRLGMDIKAAEVAFMSAKAAALRELGLSVAQYAALLALRDSPGITGAGLARACLVTPQASAATLKTLETKGLVTRHADDWNRSSLPARLTADGEHVVAEADERAGAVEQRMFDAFTGSERALLRDLLTRCRAAATGE